ncbi:MAG: hypothetical protein IPJ30_16195 [Acidobacteria bacterium]|nr:hypothetical protein [Acidobacteriota bacterium]
MILAAGETKRRATGRITAQHRRSFSFPRPNARSIRTAADANPTRRQGKEEAKEKGGIPGWFWASLALLGMFFVALVGIAAAYFIFLRPSGFDLVVLNPQPGSKVIVDGIEWSVTEGDGSLIARGLKSDEIKKIDIKAPGFVCESREVKRLRRRNDQNSRALHAGGHRRR